VADADWITAAVTRFERPLLVYVRGLLGRTGREADVVQEAFLELCRASRKDVEPKLAPWLFTVARRRALDHLRKERRMTVLTTDPPSVARSAADLLEQQDSTESVMARLGRLPAPQQEVVRLKFLEQFSYREIAGVTGLSESHVGVLIHTAIQSLRRSFTESETPLEARS